jgi:hypothetical protein
MQALMKLAMAKYNFYQCSKCKRPYYGGVAACGAIEQGQSIFASERTSEREMLSTNFKDWNIFKVLYIAYARVAVYACIHHSLY